MFSWVKLMTIIPTTLNLAQRIRIQQNLKNI